MLETEKGNLVAFEGIDCATRNHCEYRISFELVFLENIDLHFHRCLSNMIYISLESEITAYVYFFKKMQGLHRSSHNNHLILFNPFRKISVAMIITYQSSDGIHNFKDSTSSYLLVI